MRRPITALLTTMVVLAASVGAYAALGGADRGASPRAAIEPSPVRVRGHVEGLYPGAKTTIPIRVDNRMEVPVRLRWVRTIVDRPSRECADGWLTVEQIRPRTRIPANGRIRLEIPVSLSPGTPWRCQDTSFPLRYRTRVNVPEAGE